ncbi:hypothetical protein ABZ419_11640 [Streptomyces cinnamoneus]|uniref:hypothetical protein n=1 Tax=Streptomyces cinnamoneus TaxID=53446 RepID=UPI0033E4FB54
MSAAREPEEAPPWREEHGPKPRVYTWPPGQHPALRIYLSGSWRYCPVRMRLDFPDGRTAYQVDVHIETRTSYSVRTYWWDPEVMRVAHGSDAAPRQL